MMLYEPGKDTLGDGGHVLGLQFHRLFCGPTDVEAHHV
jgi:hypothetical protein